MASYRNEFLRWRVIHSLQSVWNSAILISSIKSVVADSFYFTFEYWPKKLFSVSPWRPWCWCFSNTLISFNIEGINSFMNYDERSYLKLVEIPKHLQLFSTIQFVNDHADGASNQWYQNKNNTRPLVSKTKASQLSSNSEFWYKGQQCSKCANVTIQCCRHRYWRKVQHLTSMIIGRNIWLWKSAISIRQHKCKIESA